MVKYSVGFVALLVLILYFSFVGLDKKTVIVTETNKPKVQQSEAAKIIEDPKHNKIEVKPSGAKSVSLLVAKKAMVGGAEVEWVEPDTALGEGEFGTPPE